MATQSRPNGREPESPADADRLLAEDLAALSRVTQQAMPPWTALQGSIQDAARGTQTDSRAGVHRSEGETMTQKVLAGWMQLPRRRALLGAVGSAAIASAVLLWPISYQRTVGHTVQIDVRVGESGSSGDPTAGLAPRPLAKQIKAALQAESVRVELKNGGAGTQITFVARVPQRSRAEVDTRTATLLNELEHQLAASPAHPQLAVHVSERREQVSGRVYAMALDRLIQVRVDTHGKTEAEVQAEVEGQLRTQGVSSPTVHFERRGDEKQLSIEADTGDRKFQVIRKSQGDGTVMEVTVGDIDTHRDPGMTDDQLKDKILRQLAAKGLGGTVTVHGDQVEIRAHRDVRP